MPRIAGINIPESKNIEISLCSIYGIGRSRARGILKAAQVNAQRKTSELSAVEVARIRDFIEKNYRVEGELRQEKLANIKLLKDIASYRGIRHAKRLPVRGQRTKTNSRTIRGNVRRTVGSGRRKLEKT